MTTSRRLQRLVISGLLAWTGACRTAGTVETPTPVAVIKLTENFKLSARVGSPPVELQDDEKVERFALNPQGLPSEYLIVVLPEMVNGKISVPVSKSSGTVESAAEYNQYLDLILRAHRHFLRVEFDDAREVLSQVDKQYGATYASLVIRASIAILQHQRVEAARALNMAKKIHPEAQFLRSGGGKP